MDLTSRVAGRRTRKSGLLGQAELDVAVVVVDLNVAYRTHPQFDRAVVILQADIAGNAVEANIFRARCQMQRAGDFFGVQIVGVKSSWPSMRENSISVREDLKVTDLSIRASFTLS